MIEDDIEMMKLFDFILENRNIIIGEKGLFSRDTLTMIRAIVKGKIPNDFELTKEQEKVILEAFFISDNAFDEDTPSIITENKECILKAIKKDINSVDFITNFDEELEKFVINEALKRNYILKEKSPIFLTNNYQIAMNSIEQDASSANFIINWDFYSEDEINSLIDKAIECGYILSSDSSVYLKKNKKIVLSSIKKDVNNFGYAPTYMKNDKDIFKHLLLNGYHLSSLRYYDLSYLKDIEVMDFIFKLFDINEGMSQEFIDKFNLIYNDAFNSKPTIKNFESIFNVVIEDEWEENRNTYSNDYQNIFGKICSELQCCSNINKVVSNLSFLIKMDKVLGTKYETLLTAMEEYLKIYHSDIPDKISKLQHSKDVIAKLSALYVSKSKEDYKKFRLEHHKEMLEPYYVLRKDHPIVLKQIVEISQKAKFKKLFRNQDKDVNEFVESLITKYSNQISKEWAKRMILEFILYENKELSDFIGVPSRYEEYRTYIKVKKLVNRLNSGYIKIDDVEVVNFKKLIKFNENEKTYFYVGNSFSQNEIEEFNKYEEYLKIFNKIKKDIMLKIKKIEIDDSCYSDDILEDLADTLPFTDEYFVFNLDGSLKKFEYNNLEDMISNCYDSETLIDNKCFNAIYDILVNKGLIWLQLILEDTHRYTGKFRDNGISVDGICNLIDDMPNIISLANQLKIDISDFNELINLHQISEKANNTQIAILGSEIIHKLCKYKNYTNYDEKKIVRIATELICEMSKRSKSTVPYINGETMNYKYYMYDSQDEDILLAGINTEACFRVDGNDNDFLHYCALNKNGFVIKITDYLGNFVARASGFRHGNAVYINQLRTIYDEGGNYYNGDYENEKNGIIEAFEKACNDIVSISQENEKDKIDFVFVTKSYSLSEYPSKVSSEVDREIGDIPMDTQSEDWENFVNNTNNLIESVEDGFFYTDYGNYDIICMASSQSEIEPEDIESKDVPALYERKRNKIFITNKIDELVHKKINKISAISALLNDKDLEKIIIPNDSTIFIGDNWFIVSNNWDIINSCLLEFDEKAKIEYNATLEIINSNKLNNSDKLNVEQINNDLSKIYDSKGYVKVLRKED